MTDLPYIRRGNLLGFIPPDELPEKCLVAHDKLLEDSPLFWDALFPLEAEEWINKRGLVGKKVPNSHIRVMVITHEGAQQLIEEWRDYDLLRR